MGDTQQQPSIKVHEVFAYLSVRDGDKAIDFYQRAFGAEELFRLAEPGGRIGHAEIKVGGHIIMLADEFPEYGLNGPESLGGTTFSMHLHVDNVDVAMKRAVAAGATVDREASDQFYGERSGSVLDPFGHRWLLGHHLEDVSPEEMQRRYTKLCAGEAPEA